MAFGVQGVVFRIDPIYNCWKPIRHLRHPETPNRPSETNRPTKPQKLIPKRPANLHQTEERCASKTSKERPNSGFVNVLPGCYKDSTRVPERCLALRVLRSESLGWGRRSSWI